MKLKVLIILTALFVTSCKEDETILKTPGQINAEKIKEAIAENGNVTWFSLSGRGNIDYFHQTIETLEIDDQFLIVDYTEPSSGRHIFYYYDLNQLLQFYIYESDKVSINFWFRE